MNMTDYEETRRTFRLAVPEDFNYSRDVVGAWSRTHPNKLALVAVDPGGERRRELTFADLARASNRVTNMLDGKGIGPGERAFVMLPQKPEEDGAQQDGENLRTDRGAEAEDRHQRQGQRRSHRQAGRALRYS